MKLVAAVTFMGCAALVATFAACGGDDDAGASDAGTGGDASSSSSSTSSGSGGGSSGSSGGSSQCASVADAQCRRLERCSPLLLHALAGSLADCKERFAIVCERSSNAPGANAFTAACIAALDDPSCESDERAACGPTGALPDGTPCEFDRQCATGRCSGTGGGDGCGTCKASTSAGHPAGSSCTNDDCDPGLSCIGYAWSAGAGETLGTCQPTRLLGQECTDAEDCNPNGKCNGDACALSYGTACIGGVCAKPLGEGQQCPLTDIACSVRDELICAFGASGGICTKIVFASANEPCKKTEGPAPGACLGSSRCLGDAGAMTCVPRLAEGAPCNDEDECRIGAACIGGVCTIAPADRCK